MGFKKRPNKNRKRPSTRAERRAKNPECLPKRFEPHFIETADNRLRSIRIVKKRLQRLLEESGADSYQKELIAQEAVFVSIQLETMRTKALEGEDIDLGSYTQQVNCLQGLLGKLGLSRAEKSVGTLSDYVDGNGR